MGQFQNPGFDRYARRQSQPSGPEPFQLDNTIGGLLILLILCQLIVFGIIFSLLTKSFGIWITVMMIIVVAIAVQQVILRLMAVGMFRLFGRSHAAGNITLGVLLILNFMSVCFYTSKIFDGSFSKAAEEIAAKEAAKAAQAAPAAPPPPTETPMEAMKRRMSEQQDDQRTRDAQFAEDSRRRAQEMADASARAAKISAPQTPIDQSANRDGGNGDAGNDPVVVAPPRLHPRGGAGSGAGGGAGVGLGNRGPAGSVPVPTVPVAPGPVAKPSGPTNGSDFPELDLPEPDGNDSDQDAAINAASMKYMNDLKGLLKAYSDSAEAFQADGGLDTTTLGTQAAIDARIKLVLNMKITYEAFSKGVQLASNAVKLNLNNPRISDDAISVAATALRKKVTEAGYDPVKTKELALINRIAVVLADIKHRSGWHASADGRGVLDKTGKPIELIDTKLKETRKLAESSAFLKFLQ